MLDMKPYFWTASPMKIEKIVDPENSVASCKPILGSILGEERLEMVSFTDFFKKIIIVTQIFTGIYPQLLLSRLSNPMLFCGVYFPEDGDSCQTNRMDGWIDR
jgi:hypothetical protein